MESTNTKWSKTARYIAGVSLILFGIFILYLSRSVIPMLIIAGLIAILMRPLILWLHNKLHLTFGLAVIFVYLIMAILFPLALLLLMPVIVNTIHYISNLDYLAIFQSAILWLRSTLSMVKTLPLPSMVMNMYVNQTVDSLLNLLDQTTIAPPEPASLDTILQSLTITLSTTFRTAAGIFSSLFSNIALLLFTFLASIYMSLSMDTLNDAILHAMPDQFQPELKILLLKIERTWKAFFLGELTLMLFIGVFCWLGLTILGIPGAPYLGIVAGLLEIVPNIGPILATIPAVIVALLQGSAYLQVSPLLTALFVVLFYFLVQQIENSFIVPKVLGKAVDLPPLVVMTGVLVGAEVGGLLGILLATPVIATLRDIVFYVFRKVFGEDPFPPEEVQRPAASHSIKSWYWQIRMSRVFQHTPTAPPGEPPQMTANESVCERR